MLELLGMYKLLLHDATENPQNLVRTGLVVMMLWPRNYAWFLSYHMTQDFLAAQVLLYLQLHVYRMQSIYLSIYLLQTQIHTHIGPSFFF